MFGIHSQAIKIANYFDAILTYNPYIINNFPNAFPFYHNGTITEHPEQFEENLKDKEKKFEVTFLCGTTNWAPGHKFR